VCNNALTELPADFGEANGHLLRLNINSNPMQCIPAVVMKLTKLKKLYAQHLMLSSLPADIGKLAELELLYLAGNCLRRLPRSFSKLSKLKFLILSGVPWFDTKTVRGGSQFISIDTFEDYLRNNNLKEWLMTNNKAVRMLTLYYFNA
jgi:Leucine-rich repeat (LRR) protein